MDGGTQRGIHAPRLALAALLVVCLPSAANARDLRRPGGVDERGEGIELTPWLSLHPAARESVVYTNNVLLEPSSRREEDVVFLSILQMQARAEGLRKSLDLGYAASFQHYLRNASLNTSEHAFSLDAELDFERLSLNYSANVGRLVTPTDPRFTGQIRRWAGQTTLVVDWKQTKAITLRAEGNANFIDFSQRQLNFFDQWGAGGALYAVFDPGLPISFLAGGGYRELRYPDKDSIAPDLGLASFLVGVEGELPGRLDGSLRGGWEKGWVLKRRGTPRSAATPDGLLADAKLRWRPRLNKLHASLFSLQFQHLVTFSSTADYLRLTAIVGEVNQELPLDLEAFAAVAYELQQPKHAHQLRSISGLVGLAWQPKPWLELAGQTSYTSRRSADDGDFEVLSFVVALTLRL